MMETEKKQTGKEIILQDDFECFFFLPNLHAITCPPYLPADLRRNTLSMLAQFIACGLDPKKSHMFVQSAVMGHTELAWILSTITPVGQLLRMTQFKSKSEDKDFVGCGLLYYPILMAADILLYNAKLVPVGEDQKQHLELTRDLAIKFNQTYSETFNVPEPYILTRGSRIHSLQDPTKKMSKSDPNEKGTIFLFEPIDRIRKKINSAVTDSGTHVQYSKEQAGISNLIDIFAALTDQAPADIVAQYEHHSYAKFKEVLADVVIEHIKPMQERYNALLKNKDYLEAVLKEGNQVAQARASRMMSKVYRKVGFI